MQISGKTVVITGGGAGIGLDLAKAFLSNGAKVIICGRNLSRLEQAQADNPGLEIMQCDVTNEEQILALRERCDAEFGGADILVNNAGVLTQMDLVKGDTTLEHQLKEIDINVNGPIRMVYHFLPGLLQKPEAAIVNVSSSLAYIPYAAIPVYSATKAGLHSWTLSLRKQLEDTNVRVFELMPPLVDTDMASEMEGMPKMSPEKLATTFINSFLNNKDEIVPGMGGALKFMSRISPRMMMNMMARQG
ncbi:MAG: SDR family NAD(P)-dependent oxidoreductase [Chloroflexota bacterium]